MRLRFSPAVFLIAYCAAYLAALAADLPAFRYYPLDGTFSWGTGPQDGHGPSMAWYGLMLNAGAAAAVLALVVPDPVVSRLRNRLWIFPVAALLGTAFLMRIFFL